MTEGPDTIATMIDDPYEESCNTFERREQAESIRPLKLYRKSLRR